jgi:hypothetical protein
MEHNPSRESERLSDVQGILQIFLNQRHKMDFKTGATNHAVLTLKRHLPGYILIITLKTYVFKNTPLVLNSCKE